MELLHGYVFLSIAASFFIYILPAMIAFYRRHENYTAIFLITLLLGWTGVAWLACLVWALISKPVHRQPVQQGQAGTSRYEDLERLSNLKNSGALTLEEFEREKSRILK